MSRVMPTSPTTSVMTDNSDTTATAQTEISRGERFGFGENWSRFLRIVDDERILEAERSLREMLGVESFEGRSFLDIGCGSGLFSLAAHRLGAAVVSFDYDEQSVACAEALRSRYGVSGRPWTIHSGSVLDADFMASLGVYDIVYSWGVLHHTGHMYRALELAANRVGEGGRLFIAIYNYQPFWSRYYTAVKRAYVGAPRVGKYVIAGAYIGLQLVRGLAYDLRKFRNPALRYRAQKNQRGMSVFYDWIDWIGGYPFETATPEEMVTFHQERGFTVLRQENSNGLACNQFVFRLRTSAA
ncbi:MAG: methyltransferase type 12 [Gemmatimonadetes bacterium]|nr:methyltransferase type 12 [Gemmatimonadota bacterium]